MVINGSEVIAMLDGMELTWDRKLVLVRAVYDPWGIAMVLDPTPVPFIIIPISAAP